MVVRRTRRRMMTTICRKYLLSSVSNLRFLCDDDENFDDDRGENCGDEDVKTEVWKLM